MIPLRPIGQFFKNDENGYVINPCSIDLIPNHWIPIMELIKESYLNNLSNEIHSIYLRGSLPRGFAIDRISDLDSFALIRKDRIRWQKATWADDFNVKIKKDYVFVQDIELMLSSFNKTLFEVNPRLSMVLKTQSLCIFGEDTIPSLPRFKPDKSMMLNFRWLENDLNIFSEKKDIQDIDCQEIMKTIIRSGFELVMERINKYTPDLYLCYKCFSEYYPSYEPNMKQALFLYLNPSKNVSYLKVFVDKFGRWMLKEVRKQIG